MTDTDQVNPTGEEASPFVTGETAQVPPPPVEVSEHSNESSPATPIQDDRFSLGPDTFAQLVRAGAQSAGNPGPSTKTDGQRSDVPAPQGEGQEDRTDKEHIEFGDMLQTRINLAVESWMADHFRDELNDVLCNTELLQQPSPAMADKVKRTAEAAATAAHVRWSTSEQLDLQIGKLVREKIEEALQERNVHKKLAKALMKHESFLTPFSAYLANAVGTNISEEVENAVLNAMSNAGREQQQAQEGTSVPGTTYDTTVGNPSGDPDGDSSSSDSSDSDDTDSESEDVPPPPQVPKVRTSTVAAAPKQVPEDRSNLPKRIVTTTVMFKKAVYFKTYRLHNRSLQYDSSVTKKLSKIRKRMEPEMRPHLFDGSDPITIIPFLEAFRDSCNVNGVHEGAALWLVGYFLRGSAKSKVTARTTSNNAKKKIGNRLLTYCQAIDFLLRTYATDDIIARAVDDLKSYKQDSTTSEMAYLEKLWARALRMGSVFQEHDLVDIFLAGLRPEIADHTRQFYSHNPTVDLSSIARYAHSLPNRQQGTNVQRQIVIDTKIPTTRSPPTPQTILAVDTSSNVSTIDLTSLPDSTTSVPSAVPFQSLYCRICLARGRHATVDCPLLDNTIRAQVDAIRVNNLRLARASKAKTDGLPKIASANRAPAIQAAPEQAAGPLLPAPQNDHAKN